MNDKPVSQNADGWPILPPDPRKYDNQNRPVKGPKPVRYWNYTECKSGEYCNRVYNTGYHETPESAARCYDMAIRAKRREAK
jgi:hypothetical protein